MTNFIYIVLLAAQISPSYLKLTVGDLPSLFSDADCIEGDLELDSNGDIAFINGYTSIIKPPKQSAELSSTTINIVDALFPETKVTSAISILNELLAAKNMEAIYHLESEEGPSHKPTFTVSLSIFDREFVGKGGTIKEAKTVAAKAVLDSKLLPVNAEINKARVYDSLSPTVQLNNIAAKLKMKVEYISEVYQPENENVHTRMVNLGAGKSYLKRLNESISDKVKKDPVRVPLEESTKGPFTIGVQVGEFQFIGNGNSKQMAKDNAAKKAVNAFKQMSLDKAVNCLKEGKLCNPANIKSPISILQEMSQLRNFKVTYNVISESGFDHKKTFVIRCQIGDIFTDGEDSSKKGAKTKAAEKMIGKLQSTIYLEDSVTKTKREISLEGVQMKSKKKKSKINRSNVVKIKHRIVDKVSSILGLHEVPEIIEDSKSDYESNKKDKKNSKEKLISLAKSHNINLHFRHISDKDKVITIVNLEVKPSLLCYGSDNLSHVISDEMAAMKLLNTIHMLGISSFKKENNLRYENIDNTNFFNEYISELIEETNES